MKYVICSGWWCGEDTFNNSTRVLYGDEKIRGKDFHKLWYRSINENTSPEKIFIVDSASPVLPEMAGDSRLEFVSLSLNAGHSTKHLGKYCGWTRSVLFGLQYANMCDADYFVYVEQDVLLSGRGIIEYCIDKMKKPYMFGAGVGTPHSLQQSFFIVRRDGFESFLRRYQGYPYEDNIFSPESRFAISASSIWSLVPSCLWLIKPGITSRVLKSFRDFDTLPIGYGRTRPVNFNEKFYYFQHGNSDELEEHVRIQGWK